jgi:hypothetical protein
LNLDSQRSRVTSKVRDISVYNVICEQLGSGKWVTFGDCELAIEDCKAVSVSDLNVNWESFYDFGDPSVRLTSESDIVSFAWNKLLSCFEVVDCV